MCSWSQKVQTLSRGLRFHIEYLFPTWWDKTANSDRQQLSIIAVGSPRQWNEKELLAAQLEDHQTLTTAGRLSQWRSPCWLTFSARRRRTGRRWVLQEAPVSVPETAMSTLRGAWHVQVAKCLPVRFGKGLQEGLDQSDVGDVDSYTPLGVLLLVCQCIPEKALLVLFKTFSSW